ncbi:ACT domain-containing protein [Candidatus Woesearchaeota archaeon]|nr:ACT domain-containing protein [Candidatus Woesearchaeota archaeon]
MNNPDLQEVIRNSPVVIHPGRYAYLQGKETTIKEHFLICKDDDEITIVTEEANIGGTDYVKDVKWFKLFEFKVSIPFLAPGFLAKISSAVAENNINILFVSTFSKDYALFKEEDYKNAMTILQKVGFSFIE